MCKRTILLSIIAVLISARFASVVAQTITNFTPTSGPSGTSVTITGTALTGATSVAFGGVQATSKTVTSDTQIVATVPAGAATGRITVTTPSGLAASPTYFTVQNPTSQGISSFAPTHGATGTTVTLVGTNFTGATSVKFGVSPGFAGTPASSFAVTSATSLTAVVASNTPTGLITVTTPAGTGTSTTFFTVDQALLAVRADFQNFLYTAPPASQVCPPNADGSGCGFTFFNGEVWGTIGTAPRAGTPNNGQAYLVQSSFGQPFASTMIYVTADATGQQLTFIDDALNRNKKLLYYSQADGGTGCDPYCKQDAAFRYKELQYDIDPTAQGGDGTSVVNQIEARLKPMAAFYGANERARSVQAEQTLRDALKYAPTDRLLRNSLLDLYYDRTVAELTLAREKLVNIQHLRLEPVPPGGFLIDREIAAYEDVLGSSSSPGGYRFAETGYLSLLKDTAGIDTSTVDSTASSSLPFGYYMYRTEVPVRSLYAATYLNGGVPTPVANPGGAALFSGYKDQVMMFNLFSDYAQVASELAKRYVMRGGNGDSQLALNIVNEAQKKLFAEGNVLLGVFPGYKPQIGDASGLAEAIHGWRHGLSQLTQMRDFIKGNTNILGFAPDFLMLVQSFGSGQTAAFDSYDSLAAYVVDATKGEPLTDAINRYNTALNSYATYRGRQDQLGQQFADTQTSYNARLHKIVGVDRSAAGYETPETNVGSEIYLQILSINIARNRIFLNDTRLTNLQKQIEYEIDRRGKERGIQNAMASTYISYGNKQAALTLAIGRTAALQASASAMAQAAGSTTPWGAAAQTVNAQLQAGFEIRKSELQADKERLNAQESAQMTIYNSQIADIDSDALIKNLALQESTIAIESTEAALLLVQEVARLAGLYNERADLERKMDEANASLVTRYFADPVHRLRMQSDTVDAEESFKEGQKWVFFMARALEYKWNNPFIHSYGGRTWSTSSVFKLRNAQELQDMVNSMADYNGQAQGSLVQQTPYDWFSVRNDFFGFKPTDASGQPAFYIDAATGQRVDYLTAFRRKLLSLMDAQGYIRLDFSTVREIPGASFFLGPRFDGSGNLISKGLFLDKIIWMQINLPGAYTNLTRSQLTGQLTYGGASFIRDQTPGTNTTPDHRTGEMTSFATRYWYFDVTKDLWQFSEALSSPVTMNLTTSPNVPIDATQIPVFKERSVAATGWKLVVPTKDLGITVLDPNQVNDIEIRFYHRAYVRP